MKVTVDLDACASTGGCAYHAPEVFALGEDGLLTVLQPQPDDSLRDRVERAAEMCPTGAITVAD
ncbi:MAG: ferredoxin [Actinobacteria bacterium]|nr:ferredoxin [Actinomycetota bacterium]